MYKNEYDEQDIQFLLSRVKTPPNPQPGTYDFDNFGAPGIDHLALAISENYDEATKEYNDPYSNNHHKLKSLKSMEDEGGSKLEYDYIISLQEVWERAGYGWSEEKKTDFVFDLRVGVVTSHYINDAKGKRSLLDFLNDLNLFKGDKRSFCLSWLVIAVKYDIPLTQDEINEIENELKNGSFPVKVINPIKLW